MAHRFWWLPKTLAARVLWVYALALTVSVVGTLTLLTQQQFIRRVDAATANADAMLAVLAPAVAESAVIGDYDTIKRTLENSVGHADIAAARFIDVAGSAVKVKTSADVDEFAPQWLRRMVQRRLEPENHIVRAGGKDYGVLRIEFEPQHIAAEIYSQGRFALQLAAVCLLIGVVAVWWPVHQWLGQLGELRSLSEQLQGGAGAVVATADLASDAPTEFRQTFEVLNRAAAGLQAAREQAAVTLAAVGDGVLATNRDGEVVLANPAMCELLGQSQAELLGQVIVKLVPDVFVGDDGYMPWQGRRVVMKHAQRGQVMVESTLSIVAGAEGRPEGYVLACRDVSEQHALDLRLREELASREATLLSLRHLLEGLMGSAEPDQAVGASQDDVQAVTRLITELVSHLQAHSQQLDAVFTLSPDGFVSFDADRCVRYASPAFCSLTGIPTAAVQGLQEAEFLSRMLRDADPGTRLQTMAQLRAMPDDAGGSAEGPAHLRTITLLRPSVRVLELSLREGSGSMSQVLHLRDVTHEREVDQMKSEFLSTAAHELRTPMASIYGFTELLMTREVPIDKQKQLLAKIYRQSEAMITILNELLDLARIEARRGKDFELATFDLAMLVDEAVQDFRPPDGRNPPLMQVCDGARMVSVDRKKIQQVLRNLMSNAYKYSPKGERVEVHVVKDVAGPVPRVGVQVADDGMGMTPEELAHVTERFYRADKSGQIAGTGLGMSIVKEIIELHGGSLHLSSEVNVGTVVTIWLPLEPVAETPTESPS